MESIDQRFRTNARLQLALRAERAFGVTAIRRPTRGASAGPPASSGASSGLDHQSIAEQLIAPPEPTRREPPPAPTPAQAPVDLWGRPAIEQSPSQRGLIPPPTVDPFITDVLPRDQK